MFTFEHMLTPKLVLVSYWIGLLVIAGFASFLLISGLGALFSETPLSGIFLIVGTVPFSAMLLLLWRIYCELVILLFSMYDRLGEVRNLLANSVPAKASAPRASDL